MCYFDWHQPSIVHTQLTELISMMWRNYKIMEEMEIEFWEVSRSFLIRYNQYNREKGQAPLQLEEFEVAYSRFLANRDLKEVVINRLASVETKSDYHHLILLAYLQELAKWSTEHHEHLSSHPGPVDCLLTQSINLLNAQQQYTTIVPKQNELTACLLAHPHTLNHLQHFKILYRRLKDIKEFYPAALRDHQKQLFLRTVEECVEKAAQAHNAKIIEFVFASIFGELQLLEETHELVFPRLRIMRKVVKSLWFFSQDILYRSAYLLMRYSYQIVANKQLFNHTMPIYSVLIYKLIQRPSVTALLLYKHIVLNNISKLLSQGGNHLILQALLSELANLFRPRLLEYFMRNYDFNFLEVPICQESLHALYEYSQHRPNQKKPEFELFRAYINRIQSVIKEQIEGLKGVKTQDGKWKFYHLKKKECDQILELMNTKPKKLFGLLDEVKKGEVRENLIGKYARIAKKAARLESRSMIDIFSTDNPQSAALFASYVEIVLQQCREHDLEQFMRLFTSNFFLTGEAQQIARVMDSITKLYHKHQDPDEEGTLMSSDATYTFANAILILNTDLHNPKNQNKISEEDFIKMCKKINEGEDLPVEIIKKTYYNIKRNKINNFRDRGNMLGISLSNWMLICCDYAALPLSYHDSELEAVDDGCLQRFIMEVLTGIIDEKETAKLELLVERFKYSDKVYQCEIIEILRKVSDKKPHLPQHILAKVNELANFRHSKTTDKLLSYYWLGANLIQNFPRLIPTPQIVHFLVLTWSLRQQLQDNLYLRQAAEMRRVRQCVRWITKREAKKSIMDMFSNFLSFKESDDEAEQPPSELSKRPHFKTLSQTIFDILRLEQAHRTPAYQYLNNYIHNDQSKLYQQFISCLFLTFNLLYHTPNCQVIGQDLLYELLGLKQSSITKRLSNLAKKDNKLFNILDNYCKFWILKLLLKQYKVSKVEAKDNNNYAYLLGKAVAHLQKIDKEMILDLLRELCRHKEVDSKLYNVIDEAVKKILGENIKDADFFYDKFSQKEEQQAPNAEEMKDKSAVEPKQPVQDKPQGPSSQEQSDPVKQDSGIVADKGQEVEPSEPKQESSSPAQPAQKKEEESNKDEGELPEGPKAEASDSIQNAQPSKQQESKSQEPKQQGENSAEAERIPEEEPSQPQPEEPQDNIEQPTKRSSVEPIEYVDPDAVIHQVEHEIEEHLRNNPPQPLKHQSQDSIGSPESSSSSRVKSRGSSPDEKENLSSPLPVVMF